MPRWGVGGAACMRTRVLDRQGRAGWAGQPEHPGCLGRHFTVSACDTTQPCANILRCPLRALPGHASARAIISSVVSGVSLFRAAGQGTRAEVVGQGQGVSACRCSCTMLLRGGGLVTRFGLGP